MNPVECYLLIFCFRDPACFAPLKLCSCFVLCGKQVRPSTSPTWGGPRWPSLFHDCRAPPSYIAPRLELMLGDSLSLGGLPQAGFPSPPEPGCGPQREMGPAPPARSCLYCPLIWMPPSEVFAKIWCKIGSREPKTKWFWFFKRTASLRLPFLDLFLIKK